MQKDYVTSQYFNMYLASKKTISEKVNLFESMNQSNILCIAPLIQVEAKVLYR